MTSGRYTAYHIYQDLSFPEAQKAGTWPYPLPEYQCKHSQRGYLFQFANMVERTHFDAANTSCCNEPVLNFGNKPQFAEASRPMNPQDCGAKVESVGCTVLEVFVEDAQSMCARSAAKIKRIKIKCPSQCRDLVEIQGGGTLDGTYGQFKSLGMEAGDVLILDYTPYAAVVSGWYDNCSGAGTLTEEFCGGYTLSYALKAGLNYPDGCGCDCCGEKGSFPAPSMTVYAPASVNAYWSNILIIPDQISGDESCSGGNLAGTFSGVSTGAVQWAGAAQYHSNGSTRYITRDPDTIGSSGNPGCCGGIIYWSGADGCGSGSTATTTVVPRIGLSAIIPTVGTTFPEYGSAGFSGSGACAYASEANIAFTISCLTNSGGALYRYDGYLRRQVTGQLQFSGNHACSGCCGNGSITVSFSNGCGGTYSGTYSVRRQYTDTAVVGYAYRCQDFSSGANHYYKVARADIYCNGTSGAFSLNVFGDYYSSLGACISGMSGTGSPAIRGAGGCSGSLSGSTSCCWYTDNGLSGYNFQSRVYSVAGSRCCAIQTQNGGWVFSGAGQPCCPTT